METEDYYDSDNFMSNGQDEVVESSHDVIDVNIVDRWIPPLFYLGKSLLENVSGGNLKCPASDFCIACWEKGVIPHPLFQGSLCRSCKQRILQTMFAKSAEGFHLYCTICGTKSQASCHCSKRSCSRSYCNNCLDIWIGTENIDTDDWLCFLCTSNCSSSLQPHSNWPEQVLLFHESLTVYAPRALHWKVQPLRVLSLFDGIGTGLLALRKLGIEVEVYYASEVLVAAANVSRTRLGGVLRHVGSVGEVTPKLLEDISPIHLLIGGSPCNDFSAINRFPKDFYDPNGHSRYFFDFVRILNHLRKINGENQHLLWLFENVASMPKHYRDTISRHLDCQPAVIDAKNFSAQLRRRLFWGNLPGLYTVQSNSQASTDHSLTLDKSLMPNSGRRATQAKVRTLTTNTNSLLQGRTENCANRKELASLFPVRFTFQTDDLKNADKRGCGSKENMNPSKNSSTKTTKTALPPTDSFSGDEEEQTDVLWLQEIEHVFGLPRHFTDVGNMSRSDRQKLLGHAWSVPVIVSIFSNLKNYTL